MTKLESFKRYLVIVLSLLIIFLCSIAAHAEKADSDSYSVAEPVYAETGYLTDQQLALLQDSVASALAQ